jgi:hypothetical protein
MFPAILVMIASIIFLLVIHEKMNWSFLTSSSRSFNLLALLVTLMLPLLSPFPVDFVGVSPLLYGSNAYPDRLRLFDLFHRLAIVIGSIWHPKEWWNIA